LWLMKRMRSSIQSSIKEPENIIVCLPQANGPAHPWARCGMERWDVLVRLTLFLPQRASTQG
jgi:hypothetical protein